jgi:hypothetical protein
VLTVVYVVNALFNLVQVVYQGGGFGALSQNSNVLHALLLDDLAALYKQLPAVILTVLGAIALAVILPYRRQWRTTRATVRWGVREFLRAMFRPKAYRQAWRRTRATVREFLRAMFRPKAYRQARIERKRLDVLAQAEAVKSWSEHDRELLEHYEQIWRWWWQDPEEMTDLLAHLVNKARFRSNMGIAILIPAAAVVGARLLVIWHQR